MRDTWPGLKTLAGQTQPQAKDLVSSLSEQTDCVEKFNDFYCRFNRFDLTAELSQVLDCFRQNIYTDVNDTKVEEITPKVVQRELNKLNIRKATGPDNLSGMVLKAVNSSLVFLQGCSTCQSAQMPYLPCGKSQLLAQCPKDPTQLNLTTFAQLLLPQLS